MCFDERVRIAQDVMLLCCRSDAVHNPCHGLMVAFYLLVCDAWNAIVNVQIADHPIIVLQLFHIIESRCEEQSKTAPALHIFFCVHVTAATLIGGFEYVVTDLKVAAELLAFGISCLEWETGSKF